MCRAVEFHSNKKIENEILFSKSKTRTSLWVDLNLFFLGEVTKPADNFLRARQIRARCETAVRPGGGAGRLG